MSFSSGEHLLESIDESRVERARDSISRTTYEGLNDWIKEHTVTLEVNEQPFRMLIDQSGESDHVIVAGGEFGNGIDSMGAAIRLLTIRSLVDEQATVILQPNSTYNQNNMNFTREEKKKLHGGIATPIVDRIKTAVDNVDVSRVSCYGPSQGGTTVLAYSSDPNTPPSANAIIETPNIVDRSVLKLGKDFLSCGKQLKDNIVTNYAEASELSTRFLADLTLSGLIKYGAGAFRGDNYSMLGLMRRNSAAQQIAQILDKGGSVMHGWATGDNVSPFLANQAIADQFEGNISYDSVVFNNDHSSTNLLLENAALVYRAVELAS